MLDELLVIYLILIFGSCLQSLVGFGLGLFCAPLVFFISPELVPGPMILLALLNTAILTFNYRDKIDFHQTKISVIGGTVGVVCAAFVMKHISAEQYQYMFGGLILLAVFLSVIGVTPKLSKLASLTASFLSGVMGTTTSSGGAPMGILYQSENKEMIKANLSIFFVYINFIAIIALLVSGVSDSHDFTLFIQYCPTIFIGLILSRFLNPYINSKAMRILILIVATISGLVLII